MDMPVPAGWEVRTRLEILAPRMAVPVMRAKQAALPRANVVAIRYEAGRDADDLLKTLRAGGSRILGETSFAFADGVSATLVRTRIDLPNGLQLQQDHIVRRDGDHFTHFALTYAPNDADGQRSLEQIARSFAP